MIMNEVIKLKRILKECNIIPTKKFGQNFLINQNIINKIVRSIGNTRDKIILEIGPGVGILTNQLLNTNIKSLVIIEIDKKVKPILDKIKIPNKVNFNIIYANALQVDERKIIGGTYSIVANLPYNISTLLLVKWFKNLSFIDNIIVMVQKEVANRLIARVGIHDYSRLSVLAQFTCNCELLFDVEPENFFPVPKIISSVIKLTPKKALPSLEEINKIEKVCKITFNYRRKQIRKTLKPIIASVEEELTKLKIDFNKRPEQLSVDEFFKISSIVK